MTTEELRLELSILEQEKLFWLRFTDENVIEIARKERDTKQRMADEEFTLTQNRSISAPTMLQRIEERRLALLQKNETEKTLRESVRIPKRREKKEQMERKISKDQEKAIEALVATKIYDRKMAEKLILGA